MSRVVETGDVLFDMHEFHGRDNVLNSGTRGHGLFYVIPTSFQVVSLKGSKAVVENILRQHGVDKPYLNKTLVALNDARFGQDIQCIYSYDDTRFGIFSIRMLSAEVER